MTVRHRLLTILGHVTVLACGQPSDLERARDLLALGRESSLQGQLHQAADEIETATDLFAQAAAPAELAAALNYLSDVYFRLGEFERQEEVLWRALEEAVAIGDRDEAAKSWNNLGVSFAARGRPSAALEAYQRCLELHQDLGEPDRLTAPRHNLGVQLLLLGRIDEGVEEMQKVVADRRRQGNPLALGQALASLAWGLALDGQGQTALDAYAEAVSLLDQAGAVPDLAVALEQRAQLFRTLSRFEDAREDLQRSLNLLESGEASSIDAAYLRLGLGAVEREQAEDALPMLRAAVKTFDNLGAQEGRILARLELARALRTTAEGQDEAIGHLEAAVEIVEEARSDLRLPSFRATFLGGWQVIYQELVDVLASAGFAERALEAAEKARARALLDRMAANVPESEARLDLRERIEALETEALLPTTDKESKDTAREELRRVRFAFERMQEISRRTAPPSPAASPASVEEIRRNLDGDTVLLVYSLAPRHGWLWRLDAEGIVQFSLSSGAEIEAIARNVHQLLALHDRPGYGKATRESLELLASKALGPVVGNLGPGRVVIVPDGALHLVPFGALVNPDVEVVHLPSASTLVELRRRASREPAPRLLAVVADPVFETSDPRLTGLADSDTPESATVSRTRSALNGRLGRLPASAEEAQAIVDVARSVGVAPPVHRGFDATRELVIGGALGEYRILHFATHGLVDAEDPSLAGLVLSLYDDRGRPRDGLLRVRDLHGLRLSADLVVLSACRTALGQEIRGEGLVGLVDGFFAAGANHLLVSLWDVDDRATAELMERFYRHLLLEGRRPADALRRAQVELRDETEWNSPAYWAAFVTVGDPHIRPRRPPGDESSATEAAQG